MNQEDVKRYTKFIAKLSGKVKRGEYSISALCPAHDDARLSLGVRLSDKGVILVNCLAGCETAEVCAKLGFTIPDLYGTPKMIDVFEFFDLEHLLQYQEVKYDETALERFKARRPGTKKGESKWEWDVKDKCDLILYNWYNIATAPMDTIIFMCEGCKDARTLIYHALYATAALWNNWGATNTKDLDGRPIIVLVDNDDGGEVKALTAAHDRYGKSKYIKLLRLPGLLPGGDVTDWLDKKGENTVEKLMALATSDDLKLWHPSQSIRQRVDDKLHTGLCFEHRNPRPAFEVWYNAYHPPEEGLLYTHNEDWLKGDMEKLIYYFVSKSSIIETMFKLFELTYNKNSKKGEEDFKPTSPIINEILTSGASSVDLDALKNPIFPIYNPFFKAEKIDNYEIGDVALLKSTNFYIPERICFPRNMEKCIALSCLPFDYEENAVCPEIRKAIDIQWKDDQESIDLLLQHLYYYMLHHHKYKSIMMLVDDGKGNTGKSVMLDLIRHFIGEKNCESIALSKLGGRFELYDKRNAKLLISDDVNLTKRDLLDGSIVENVKSIPQGAPIRVEKKVGEIITFRMACQMLLAGNNPPSIQEFSNALSNRFMFLVFTHEFIRGHGMDTDIISKWLPELSGMFNMVLDAGPKLIATDGFIEPKSSHKVREKFEGGGNPLKKYIYEQYDINNQGDTVTWLTRLIDLKTNYALHCEESGETMIAPYKINTLVEAIPGIERYTKNLKIKDAKTGGDKWKQVKCWAGMRLKGTSGIISTEDMLKTGENEPEAGKGISENDDF